MRFKGAANVGMGDVLSWGLLVFSSTTMTATFSIDLMQLASAVGSELGHGNFKD